MYPENTLPAIRRSLPHVDGIEVDVRRCASGELVVVHDDRLDRVTDGTGVVAETTWEELRRLTVEGSGARIPRLAEIIDAVPDGHRLVVELKEVGVATDACALLADAPQDVLVQSFLPPAIAAATQAAPELSTGLLARADADPSVMTEAATNLGCDFVNPHYSACLDGDAVDRFQAAGFATFAWTIDDPSPVDALLDRGVDGLIVDRWDVLEPTR